jgi:hypothetical protein
MTATILMLPTDRPPSRRPTSSPAQVVEFPRPSPPDAMQHMGGVIVLTYDDISKLMCEGWTLFVQDGQWYLSPPPGSPAFPRK